MRTSRPCKNGLDGPIYRFEYWRFSKLPWLENVTSPERARSGEGISIAAASPRKGGIGMHVTKATTRWHLPNLKTKRVWVPELKKFVTVKATARAFKTLSKNGTYKTLAKASVVR